MTYESTAKRNGQYIMPEQPADDRPPANKMKSERIYIKIVQFVIVLIDVICIAIVL